MKLFMVLLFSVILFGCSSNGVREAERERKEAELRELKDQYALLKEECEKGDTLVAGLLQLYTGSLFDKPTLAQKGAANIGGGVMSNKDCFYKERDLRNEIEELEKELLLY